MSGPQSIKYLAQAILFIDGEISSFADEFWGGTSLKSVREQLAKYDSYDSIKAYINSPGGSVTEGFAIMDYLDSLPVPVTTTALGQCASIATAIFLAGDTREIGKYAEFFIHLPWGFAGGTADDIEAYLTGLRQAEDKLIDLYVAKTGIDRDLVKDLMDKQTSLSADKAKEHGFATLVLEPVMAMAMLKDTPKAERKATAQIKPAPTVTIEKPIMATKNILTKAKIAAQAFLAAFSEIKALALTLTDGTAITVDTDADMPAVGDEVTLTESGDPAPDGTHELPDGKKLVTAGGKITEIIMPQETETTTDNTEMTQEQAQALQKELSEAKDQIKALEEKYADEVKASAKFRQEVSAKLDTIVSGGKVTRDADKEETVIENKSNKSPQQLAAERRAGKQNSN